MVHIESNHMVHRLFQKLLIHPQDIASSDEALEVIGTFNPGVTEFQDEVLLLVRVAEWPRSQRPGYIGLPRWKSGQVVIDWVPAEDLDECDPRVVRKRRDGLLRLTFTSHLCLVRSRDGRSIDRWDGPRLIPQEPWEEFGIEDPRLTFIDGRYWITYVAVSRHGAATALISTVDFVTFERHGIIFCPENKDVVLFPEKIDGHYLALHRPTTAHAFCRPEMWLARSPDLLHWGTHQVLHGGDTEWENDRVGAGAPPIRTKSGWLEIYHAGRRAETQDSVGTYAAGAILLDPDDPTHVVGHTRQALWEPDVDYELSGFVPRVVFPTGIVPRGDIIQLYYGAADTYTAVVEFQLSDIDVR